MTLERQWEEDKTTIWSMHMEILNLKDIIEMQASSHQRGGKASSFIQVSNQSHTPKKSRPASRNQQLSHKL